MSDHLKEVRYFLLSNFEADDLLISPPGRIFVKGIKELDDAMGNWHVALDSTSNIPLCGSKDLRGMLLIADRVHESEGVCSVCLLAK